MHPVHTPLAHTPCQGCDCERHADRPARRSVRRRARERFGIGQRRGGDAGRPVPACPSLHSSLPPLRPSTRPAAAQSAARPEDSNGLWRAMMNRWLPVDPAD
ncbi:hypothetical protein [Azospirillum canadense]|uniref:hypothetical protein n=1 Tax=Azospirillum canadense TaxID=403962 RepID=UPI0022261ECF|nr:hypothetical protein [Azospirillum canadense]MCW2237678.1 hypothetical protein [Azospirillum canadense]